MDTFLTVSKQSSKRALDMPASYVGNLTVGDEIYIESYGRKFVWDAAFPSGTATVDGESFRPLSWSANGAFIADLNGSERFWKQSAWFVSTSGDDENDGLTSATPVKTDIEIQRRWGVGRRARLSSAVTITYAQSPTTQTSLLYELVSGGTLTFVGTPTITKAGTVISAVQAQVRTAGAEAGWAITGTGLGATEVNKIVVITSSGTGANVNAYAMVLKDETGGKVRVSPFGTYNAATGAFTQVTPQVGDIIEIRDMSATTLTLGKIEGHTSDSSTSSFSSSRTVFDSLFLDSLGSGSAGNIHAQGGPVYYARCMARILTLTGVASAGATQHFWRGGGVANGGILSVRSGATVSFSQIGVLNASMIARGGGFLLSSDCYFQNSSCTSGSSGTVSVGSYVGSSGSAFFDRATSNSSIVVGVSGVWTQSGAVPDWGTLNAGHGIVVQSIAGYSYATKPTVNSGLGAGRETQIGGADKLYSEVPYIEATNNAALVLTA